MGGNNNDSDGSDYDVEDFFGHRAPVASRAPPMPAPKFAPGPQRSNQFNQGNSNAYGNNNNSNNRQYADQRQQPQFGQRGRNAHGAAPEFNPRQDSRANAQPARRQQQQQSARPHQRDQPRTHQDQDQAGSEESSASGSESDDDVAAPKSAPKSTTPKPAPVPVVADTRTFSELGVHPTLIHHLANRMNITDPTPIQRAVYSTLLTNAKLSHRDVAIQSETGSGKTLSFLLPIIQSLLFPDPEPTEQPARTLGPLCLVLAPTRELAQQIHGVLEQLTNISRSGGAAGDKDAEEEEGDAKGQEAAAGDDKQYQDQQQEQQEKLFVPRHWLVSGTIVGGDSKKSEKARIRKGINIIVSTPGRFLDHLRTTRNLDATRIRWIVLDEADRLLDLGFERDLKAIWAYLHGMPDPGRTMDGSQPQQQQKAEPRMLPIPPTFAWPNRRQVFLCSATIHKVASLAAWVLDKPVRVSARGLVSDNPSKMLAASAADADDSGAPSLLKHQYLIVPLKLKLLALVTYLADMARGMHHSEVPRKLIVFFSTRGAVDYFHTLLARFFSRDRTDPVLGFQAGLDITKLHGSMDANERKAAIAGFADAPNMGKSKRGSSSSSSKGGKGQVLITTDVAARGLDLHGVDLIIQFDAPTDVAEYVHRAGRTARAGRKGAAVLILTPHEEEFATTMIAEKVGTMEAVDIATKIGKLLRCPDMDAWEKAAVRQWQIPFEDWVAKDKAANTLAMLGFQAHVKGYATYPSALKPIFHVRKLHLGHLAKSFCLRDAPTELHQVLGQNQQQAANAKKKREAEAADGEGGEPAKKKKKVFADGVESYAKTAKRQFSSEFQTSAGAYLGGKKKRK